jgi:hypothetical protein
MFKISLLIMRIANYLIDLLVYLVVNTTRGQLCRTTSLSVLETTVSGVTRELLNTNARFVYGKKRLLCYNNVNEICEKILLLEISNSERFNC